MGLLCATWLRAFENPVAVIPVEDGAGDLALSPRWTEWYGKDLDVRAATKLLSQKQYKFVQLQSETGATAEEMASSGADEQVVVILK